MKKGRHRRFEEARALKRANDNLDELLDRQDSEPCIECDAPPGHDHADWCRATEEEDANASDDRDNRDGGPRRNGKADDGE